MRSPARHHYQLNQRLDALVSQLDAYYPATENGEYLALAHAQAQNSYRATNRALAGLETLIANLRH